MEEQATSGEAHEGELGLSWPQIGALDARYSDLPDFVTWSLGVSVDEATWDGEVARLDELAARLPRSSIENAYEVAVRTAAVDTGALEGLYATTTHLTQVIALQSAGWTQQMRSSDEAMMDFFEAHLRAYEAAGAIADSTRPVTESWIRELHEVVTAAQATYSARTPVGRQDLSLPKGQYKQQSNHVQVAPGVFHPFAPAGAVPQEMHHFVEQLNSTPFAEAHPVIQAAYAHFGLVWIHPFVDGNGRVARALATVFLRRRARIPLVIWNDQRAEYHRALERADEGERQAFVEFIFDRALETFSLVVNEAAAPLEQQARLLSEVLASHGGLSHRELDELAGRVRVQVQQKGAQLLAELELPVGASFASGSGEDSFPVETTGFRAPVADKSVALFELRSGPQASVRLYVRVLISTAASARRPLRVEVVNSPDPLDLPLAAVHPQLGASFDAQLSAWLRRHFSSLLSRLVHDTAEQLRRAGYRPSP